MSSREISEQTQTFVAYKQKQQHFFSEVVADKNALTEREINGYIETLTKQLSDTEGLGHAFLEDHLELLTQEQKQLMSVLKENDRNFIATKDVGPSKAQERSLEKERFLAMHYSILLLIYTSYYYGLESDQAGSYRNQISQLIKHTPQKDHPWHEKLLNDLYDFASVPMHTSKIQGWIGFLNIYRIHIVMDRLTWQQIWQFGIDLHWIEQFENFLGLHVNTGILAAPAGVSNALSVGLFASRFMLNAGLLIKHTFYPADNSRISQRFWNELKKRHWVMVNDLIWGTVNALTNYNVYFHIANTTANWVLAGFLVFDAVWLGWKLYLDQQNYRTKKSQYEYELENTEDESERALLIEQLRHLKIEYLTTRAGTLFSMAAAFLVASGLSAALVIASPALIPAICFFICTIAVAIYLSAGKFSDYVKASLIHEQSKASADQKAKQSAFNDFVIAMLKNTFMPLLIVGLFTINLPAAIALTLLYIGYECSLNYQKQAEKAQILPLTSVERGGEIKEERHQSFSSLAMV